MSIIRILAVASMAVSAAGGAVASAQPAPAAMTGIRAGRWEVAVQGQPMRALCVARPETLVQIRHGAGACTRLVIAEGSDSATIHYTCPGAGWGRTTLRVSTPHTVRIFTQGIADNAPFDYQARARRVGDCAGQGSGR